MKKDFFGRSIALSMISLGVFTWLTPSLYASGLLMYEQGDPAIGTAAVGQQVADDATSSYYNPAAMTNLERSEVFFGSQLLMMNAEFKTDDDVRNPFVGSDGGDAGMILPGGGFYYAQKLYKNRLAAGFAFNAPMGLGMDYENGWKGRYAVQDEMLLVTNMNPSLSLKMTDWLHVGGGLSVYYMYMNQNMAVFNPPSVALAPLQITPNADGEGHLKMDDWAVGYNLGFLLKPRKGTKVGFSYRSQAEFKLKGHLKLDGLGDYLASRVDTKNDIESEMTMPRQIMVSTSQDISDRLTMLFDVGWQDWSTMKNITIAGPRSSVEINQDWTDTWRLGVGTHYRLMDRLKLKLGFSYDSDPSSLANRNPMMPVDQTWRWGTGFDYDLNPNMVLSLNWEFVGMGSARIDKNLDPIVIDPRGERIGPTTLFPGREFRGEYNQYINLIGISFRWKFGKGEPDGAVDPQNRN